MYTLNAYQSFIIITQSQPQQRQPMPETNIHLEPFESLLGILSFAFSLFPSPGPRRIKLPIILKAIPLCLLLPTLQPPLPPSYDAQSLLEFIHLHEIVHKSDDMF